MFILEKKTCFFSSFFASLCPRDPESKLLDRLMTEHKIQTCLQCTVHTANRLAMNEREVGLATLKFSSKSPQKIIINDKYCMCVYICTWLGHSKGDFKAIVMNVIRLLMASKWEPKEQHVKGSLAQAGDFIIHHYDAKVGVIGRAAADSRHW